MEQHPVPQNVTTFQFRLIGDMTIKQFGYLAAGAIAAYVSYKLPLPFFFTWPMAIASALLGFGLAFVPIEERPMDIWILSFFKSIYSPTEYVWHKAPPQPQAMPQPPKQAEPTVLQSHPQTVPQPQTSALARHMPTMKNPLAGLISFFDVFKMPQRSRAAVTQAPMPPAPKSDAAASVGHTVTDAMQRIFSAMPAVPTHERHTIKPPPAPSIPMPKQAPQPSVVPMVYTHRPFDPFGWIKDMFPQKPRQATYGTSLPDVFSKVPTGSITGKRLDLSTPPQVAQVSPQVAQAVTEAKKKTTALEQKLGTLQQELQSKTLTEDRILELQKQLTDALGQRENLEKELMALHQKLDSAASPQSAPVSPMAATTATATPPAGGPTVRIITPDAAVKAGLPKLTTFPNVVTGIIKDNANTLLPGVLITVRDTSGIPLRALKTNKLGQFAASTPLPNGTYLVEVEDPRNRFVFDRAQITVLGAVMPPLEITAKSMKEVSREKLAKEIFGSQTP
ncbi:MAG: hypothetical protein UY27_C0006G0025 [Candidatus Gottesmanbacteria bacterium GW2011_GWA1_48_13]|uniref:Uncharacterized protein n=1 Tax=Candidatus Gottesmanbacteria bacterium GW2011_GWA1_48_13 TaxID=1618439 RepID=A0A0G1UP25_9BACT|nr:MAG: hypothetical protein UY27_C0006G0025 [Candidatus Gottesmanbacteria bacterium GW2011_GWA1_48_13]